MKVIFHLDLDCYFVSAERTVNLALVNKPVVTLGQRRSVVSALSYEAKQAGIKIAMPFYRAQQLVPNLISIKPNFALYMTLSSKLFDMLLDTYQVPIEVASIDECYMDVTSLINTKMSIRTLALQIQNHILTTLKLPVSIGVGANKFVAKMSTQINKPFGITITKPGTFLDVFGSWPIIKFHGIGAPTMQKLKTVGVDTIGDLAHATITQVEPVLGKMSAPYIEQANGNGSDMIDISYNELKSVGNSVTFQDKDRHDRAEILTIIENLCHIVATRMYNRNLVGSVVTIALKAKGGDEVKRRSRQTHVKVPIQSFAQIYHQAQKLFNELWNQDTIKFVGITVSKLQNMFITTYQMRLFEQQSPPAPWQAVLDNINQKYQKRIIYLGKEQVYKNNKQHHQSKYLASDRILKYYDKK